MPALWVFVSHAKRMTLKQNGADDFDTVVMYCVAEKPTLDCSKMAIEPTALPQRGVGVS